MTKKELQAIDQKLTLIRTIGIILFILSAGLRFFGNRTNMSELILMLCVSAFGLVIYLYATYRKTQLRKLAKNQNPEDLTNLK